MQHADGFLGQCDRLAVLDMAQAEVDELDPPVIGGQHIRRA